MKISQAAFDLIVAEEDTGEAYYERHYTHFEFPGGASGPTIGIGYDLGYVSKEECANDWGAIVDNKTLAILHQGCGITGSAASRWVTGHRMLVTISWDEAIREFSEREIPKWEVRVEHALPNTDLLSGDSFGALVSLAYNRGAGVFSNPGSRYAEGRAIHAHMLAKTFEKIPADILSMRRLWPKGGDLWRRRGHEAALFQRGLAPADVRAAEHAGGGL